MTGRQYFRSTVSIAFVLLAAVLSICCSSGAGGNVVIENDFFRYEIARDGKNVHFKDKESGKDLLVSTPSKCAFAESGNQQLEVTAVSREGDRLKLEFGKPEVAAAVQIAPAADRVILRVASVTGNIDTLTFLNVPLAVEGQPHEPFAACALSMNLFTHVRLLPPLQTHLWAKCYRKFGLEQAEVTLLGLPQAKMLPVIREVMKNAKDVPHSDAGGAWALQRKEGFGSYLMNFGTLNEKTVDEWIDRCRILGFNQIDSHGGRKDFFEFGSLTLDPKTWPDGWETFKRINDRLHKAGISHIFHTYAFFIDKRSALVTPVPHKDLGYKRKFTLKEPLTATSDKIVVNESTADVSTIIGFHTENSVTLRIGDEFIVFGEVTHTPPYTFSKLKRGSDKTKRSAHAAGEPVLHMSERFGRFVPGPDTPLFAEVAAKHAEIINKCGFDGIYLDAIDGAGVLGGRDWFWYYGTKFIFEIAKRLERPVGMEMSSMSHHWWHYRSRWQAWDRPNRGYKRFTDIHLASIKASARFLPEQIESNEWEHGIWRGHSPLIDKYAAVETGQIMLPLHLGWWGNQVWNPPQAEPTFSDDLEYLGCKMIGNNAGLSQLGGVEQKVLDEFPLYKRSTEIIKRYEELRQQNYFNDSVRSMLRQPGKEFTLFQEPNGKWNFKPAAYPKHKVAGLDHPSAKWTVNNDFGQQPVKLRLEALMSVKPYNDPSNVVLAEASKASEFAAAVNAKGVSGSVSAAEEKTAAGEPAFAFSARNNGESPQDGSYVNLERTFQPWLDLKNAKALGVWVKGDGSGQLLNLSLRSPMHLTQGAHGDHFIKVDFNGWRYFELVEVESSAISDYIWPNDSHFYVYDSYRHAVRFESVEKLQLWYNNLPAGKEVRTLVGPVKAIPMVPGFIENPSITIAGKTVVFPVKMESGMYLELLSPNDCKLYGPKGELIAEVKPQGDIPVLSKGSNEVSFSGSGPKGMNPRVQVTVISHGEPLGGL